MTAYRQQAVACAAALALAPARPRDLKPAMPDAPRILLSNVYGWFIRVERGIYTLSEGWKGSPRALEGASSRSSATSAVHPAPDISLHCANCREVPITSFRIAEKQ
jgi:hypothetical protein